MENAVVEKSFELAVKVVKLTQGMRDKKEFELARQLLRCGTSVGANIAESQRGQSDRDFLSKLQIAAKEANETEYWLKLLRRTDIISEEEFEDIYSDVKEVIKLLMSITKTMLNKMSK